MPQPLKRKKNQKIDITPASVILRPWAAIGIANIAANWSKLESTMGLMYTYLLHGKDSSGFEFYHDLFDMSLREKAFMAAARGKLSDELTGEVKRLYVKVRKLAKSRNTVVHGNWAMCETEPNSIYLSNPKDMATVINKLFRNLILRQKHKDKAMPATSFDLSTGEYIEYNLSDFDLIVRRIIELEQEATSVSSKILQRALQLLTTPDDQLDSL